MSSVCGPTVGEIRRATEHLRRSEFSEAVEVLGDRAPSSVVSESLALAARGCLHEGQGEVEEAAECFDRVYELGVPLLPLLHQCGRYFKRVGQYERGGITADSLCWHVTPWVIHEFLDELPSREMRLYAPFLIAARPGLWSLQPVKSALAQELGGGPAAVAYAEMAGFAPGFTVKRMPMVGLHDFAEATRPHYEELVSARDIVLPAPPIFPTPHAAGGLAARSRTMFLCRLVDAIVSNKSSVVLCDDHALLDVQDDELERFALDLDLDPVVFGPSADDATILIAERAVTGQELDRGFALTGVATVNFGHWLLEYLPKVFGVSRPARVLLGPDPHRFANAAPAPGSAEALHRAGAPRRRPRASRRGPGEGALVLLGDLVPTARAKTGSGPRGRCRHATRRTRGRRAGVCAHVHQRRRGRHRLRRRTGTEADLPCAEGHAAPADGESI